MTVERANLNDQSLNVDIETTVPKVQINRCVVEIPNDSVTDRFDDCSPVILCLDKVNQPVMVNLPVSLIQMPQTRLANQSLCCLQLPMLWCKIVI